MRFGPAASGLYAATTTGTSTGAVIASHDSFTPLGGAAPLVNMMLGEVSPGGVGAGLYGMLVFALLAVFIAGLMVGRTPEYLGKKIQAAEMKLVVLYILVVPLAVLGFTGGSVLMDSAAASILSGHQGHRTGSPRSPMPSPRPPTTTARPSAASPATPTGTTRRSASRC